MLNIKRIKFLIQSNGLKTKFVAEEIGYTYHGFNKALNRGSMDYFRLKKLAELLGVPLSELTFEQDDTTLNEPKENYDLKEQNSILKRWASTLEDRIKDLEKKVEDQQNEIDEAYRKLMGR